MLGELAALVGAACWAVAPIIYKRAMSNTSPIAANTMRSVSTTVVMILILLIIGKGSVMIELPWVAVVITIISGIFGLVLGDTFYMLGLRTVGVSVAAPIVSTYPLFSMIWSMGFLGEPVTIMGFIGTFIIIVGIWLLSRGKDKDNGNQGNEKKLKKRKFALTGVTAALATSFVWSFSILLMDIAMDMPGVETIDDNYALLVARILAMAIIMLMLTPIADRKWEFLKMKRRTVIELCAAGIIANGIGWLLMNYSLMVLEETAIVISSTTPLFSTLAAFLWFKEKATVPKIVGSIIVVAGVILIL